MTFSYLCKSSEFFQSLQIMFLKQLFVQASGKVCKPLGESLQSSVILDYLKQQLETFVCLRSNFGNLPIFNRIANDCPSNSRHGATRKLQSVLTVHNSVLFSSVLTR